MMTTSPHWRRPAYKTRDTKAKIQECHATPSLNIVIQVVGSRGDIQPFVALGLALARAGHRIRIATHGTFKEFVETHGLEFFNIGGDPKRLMAYMIYEKSLMVAGERAFRAQTRSRSLSLPMRLSPIHLHLHIYTVQRS
jgi:hypothetical protein